MKGDFGQLMMQALKLQESFERMQEELASIEKVGEAGGGAVTVTMTGQFIVRSVKIDPALMEKDAEALQKLIAVAVNGAIRQVAAQTMGQVSGTGLMPPVPLGGPV